MRTLLRSAPIHRSCSSTATRTRLSVEALEDRRVPATLVAITDQQELFVFDSASPGQGQRIPIQGLVESEQIRGIDFGPESHVLYGLTFSFNTFESHLYAIDARDGRATRLTSESLFLPDRGFPGVDLDYVAATGELRVATTGIALDADSGVRGFNYRINPSTLTVHEDPVLRNGTQSMENISGLASMPSDPRPFLIDVGEDRIARLVPSTGQVTLGGLLQVAADSASLDIAANGTAYAMLSTFDTAPRLYTINLNQGNATDLGVIGNGLVGRITEIAVWDRGGRSRTPDPRPAIPTLTGDVTGVVRSAVFRVRSRKGRRRMQQVIFTNTTGQAIQGPLMLILSRLNKKFKLANRTGSFLRGKAQILPYLIWDGVLNPGESVTFTLQFSTLDGTNPRYGWQLLAGVS